MNRVQINLKHGTNVNLIDDNDDMTRDQLSENLSALFSINSVAILKTNNTSLIIRPSDISSIQVDSVEEAEKPKVEKIPAPPKKEPEKEPEIVEDIITDMDD